MRKENIIKIDNKKFNIVCYHKNSIKKLGKNLEIKSLSSGGCIEAIKHNKYPIYGWMWHPERNLKYKKYFQQKKKKNFYKMKAIILAAGRGSRINHITKYKPKALIKFKKKTLLQNQIEIFKSNKISKIYLVTGYMKNKFENYKVKKIYNKKWKSSNMIYSLLLAEKILLKEECIVSYGDVYYENDAIKKIKK